MTIELALPQLRPDQDQIVQHPAKTKVLAMGRRWGKSTLGGVVIMNVLRQGGRAAWIVPEYKNGRALWRYASNVCAPLVQARIMQMSKSERVITAGSGFFGIFSADNIDSIRSEAFHLVVGDEYAMIDPDGWNDAVMPTLADYDGDEFRISTPKGKNHFYYDFMKGMAGNDDFMSWTAPTSANPLPNIQKAYGLAKGRVPERTYRQEWQAQFVDDGTLFRGVADAAKLKPQEPKPGAQYVIGVDWGRTNDATVFCVLDVGSREQAHLDHMTNTDYASQRLRLRSLAQRYNNAVVMAELNSIGQPNVEALQGMGVPVQGFTTTNASKAQIVQALELAFEQGSITLLDDPTQTAELMAYQSEKLPSGLIRYNAPKGMHDDTVMALAIALHATDYGRIETMPSLY